MGRMAALLLILVVWTKPVHAQTFANSPAEAITAVTPLAREIVNDPLRMQGLFSVIWRYNTARAQQGPAGYEDERWLNELRQIMRQINSRAENLGDGVSELSDGDIQEMASAFQQNGQTFFGFYDSNRAELGFQRIEPDQFLQYLTAYSMIANTVDPELAGALWSFTGVWPLCFWNR